MRAWNNITQGQKTARVRFLKGTLKELGYNASRSRRWLILDAGMLLACAVLFYANRLVLINMIAASAPGTLLSYIANCHLNDIVGGFAFMCYANLLLDLVKPEARFKRITTVLVFILLCGVFWEYVAPEFVEGSTSDPLDIVAYTLGGSLYWLMCTACHHRGIGNDEVRC